MAKRKPKEEPIDDYPVPEHLGPIAKECWRDSVAQLREIGLLHTADKIALEMYCSAYERYRNAEARIRTDGETQVLPNGYEQVAPWVTSMHKNQATCLRFQMQYGLTPAARAKIKVVQKQGEIPPEWKGIFGG